MKPPDKDGSGDREGQLGTLLLLHGGLNDPDAEPTAAEPTAIQDPPLPSSNALGPNSNLHLGWYLPADNTSQPAPDTTAATSSAQPPAEADAATPAHERADLRVAAPVTAATERALSAHDRDQPPPSWARSVPGDRPASASAPVPFPGLAARALSTLTGRVTIGRLGIGVLAAAAALTIVLMPVSGMRPTSLKRPVPDAGSVFLVPPILTARATSQARAAAHHTRHVGHSNPRERRVSKVSEPRRTIVAANARSNFSAERSAPSSATTPPSQSAATTTPTPAAATETSPTPAATSSAGSSAANQSSSSNARPAFGYNGTLGPGHSPDS
jgi:hypothetical protein